METLTKEQIKQYLPHREPMLLIDEAYIDDNGIAHGKYLIKQDEFFTRGHFPGNPIVPGVIQCEIMAQSCAILVKEEIPGHNTLYVGIDKVRFKSIVRPGDLCEVSATLNERRGEMFFCSAKLEVKGKLCCKGQLTFALMPKE
ncbi:MAG: beta-hydroxyacyl-ACP dehydratase [Bacteroidales bacterium]|jgi:3-hydroxyacyl-[acyl-carrier-protein] dehydratase|nr:beta-hydroxyacyl-ACP dehydratase [Bacteroidales bacterium]MCI1785428.1 beta-hydroxyacyl-ACP dehydratase [Bacteroidales bacterium]